jgi:hypothetical protein
MSYGRYGDNAGQAIREINNDSCRLQVISFNRKYFVTEKKNTIIVCSA